MDVQQANAVLGKQNTCCRTDHAAESSSAKHDEQAKLLEGFFELRSAVLGKNVLKLRHLLSLDHQGESNDGDNQFELSECQVDRNKRLLSTLDTEGLTLMHQAIFTKSVPILSALLEGGGDVNARDEEGCTLLHTAAMCGNCLIAGWLLKEGANPAATDAEGLLPIDRTEDCGMEDLLLSAMSLAGHVSRRAHISLDLSEADDSDYATGSSSFGSYSEDDDGVLSLTSCMWQDEDDVEISNEPDHLKHGPFLTLEDIRHHSPERSTFQTSGECTSNDSPVGSCRRNLSQALTANADLFELEYDSEHDGAENVPSFLATLADGVRLWQQKTQQSGDDEWPDQEFFMIKVLSCPAMTISSSRALPVPHSGFAEPLVNKDSANSHKWSKIHREVIMTGFQIVTKRHAELLQRTKLEMKRTLSAEAASDSESPRKNAISRWATMSESDLGWVLPRNKRQLRPVSILRHRSLSGACASPRKQILARAKHVQFPAHIVFQDAVTSGNLEEVQDLVMSGDISMNTYLPTGHLPLHVAVSNRQRAIAQFLLASGAEVDGRDINGWTALHTAANEGTIPLTNLLLEYNANPMAYDDRERSPLMLSSNPNVRLVLQNASRDAMSRATKQRQAMQETANLLDDEDECDCEDEDTDICSEDTDDSTDVDEESLSTCFAPQLDTLPGDSAIPDSESFDDEDEDALVTFPCLEDDISHSSNPRLDETQENTLIEVQATSSEAEMAENEEAATPTPSVDTEATSIIVARSKGVHFSPCVLLRHAILSKDTVEVRSLLRDFNNHELGLNQAELSGVTAMHQAVIEEAEEVLELLLKDGRSDVNARDADGWTPLHAAAAVGNKEMAAVLIQHGALATILSDDGKFPIELAENVEIEGLLRQAMQTD